MKRLKKVVLLFTVFMLCSNLQAQNPGDTIVVNTFNYSMTYGSGIRDTTFNFPDLPGITFEKIIMKYNMRCKNGLVSNGSNTNLGCGEWDYSCNTYVHDPTRTDSVQNSTPSHRISGFSGTTFNYTTQPTFDYYQYLQQNVVLNSILSENQYPVLAGTSPMSQALRGTEKSGKSQFLYTASELLAAGLSAGNVDGFLLNALNAGDIQFFNVKMKGTVSSQLDSINIETTGFTDVFYSNYSFVSGSNRIQFHTPFVWNGTDNIIFEFTFDNSVPTNTIQIAGTLSPPAMGISTNNGYYQNFTSNGHIDLATAGLGGISNEVTVAFWAFGDANQLPANTTIIEGLGAANERDLNVHLPWSDASIYWDCGGSGGYDRINRGAAIAEYEGQWNHWAFVKNATAGFMQIFLNGVLWQSGIGKTKPIDIAKLVIGKSATYTNNYKGSMDELSIWKKALSVSEIAGWMRSSINTSHPQYPHLVAYYPMNEGAGNTISDLSVNAGTGTANASAAWGSIRGKDLNRFFESTGMRPSLTLFSGTYSTTVNPTTVLDSVMRIPNVIEEFAIVSQAGTTLNDNIVTVSTQTTWNAVPQNVFDGITGAIITTIPVVSTASLTPTTLNFMNRWPMKFEIMSFVTPYGINLNMGPNGKTWTFDMTDFAPILKGSRRMTMERGGQWQEDMDIQFLFIVGTPYRDVLDIREVWRTESRPFASILNNQFFAPIDVPTLPNGDSFKVRTSITGHGQEGEFIPRQHTMNVNGGGTEFTWEVWKECAENPIYPQGGTWIYDRAGWCPGMATDVRHNDITQYVTPGTPVKLDYGLTTATGSSNYIVSNQLVTYGAINHTLDASIVDVMQPTDQVEYARFNSICHSPKVIMRNTGATVLTSAKINYWVNNTSTPQVFNWTGNLATGQTTEISLPSPSTLWSTLSATANTFYAEVVETNGAVDQYALNNQFKTNFTIPEVMPSDLIIQFRTNSFPAENAYEIVDIDGNVVFSRNNMDANTTYRDTLNLPQGCYTYNVVDTDDDGISFWANSDGSGFTRFQKVGGVIVKNFIGDFGDNIRFNFTVDFPLSYEEINGLKQIDVYPNPTTDMLNITLRKMDKNVTITLMDQLGKTVLVEQVETNYGLYEGKISLADLPSGMYVVIINDATKNSHVKVIKE